MSSALPLRPRVLVIIVTWNGCAYVLRLLAQVASQVRYNAYDVVVVDNASTDGTVDAIRSNFSWAKIIANRENLGGSGGFNTGLRHALANRDRYGYIWLLDNDVQLVDDPMSSAIEILERDPTIGALGSMLLAAENPQVVYEIGGRLRWQSVIGNCRGQWARDCTREQYDCDYVASCSAFASMRALEQVGLWDEDYFIYYDDIDFFWRIKQAGYRVIATTRSRVIHPSYTEKRQSLASAYYATRNAMHFFKRGGTGIPWTKRAGPPRPLLLMAYDLLVGDIDRLGARIRGLRDFRIDVRAARPPMRRSVVESMVRTLLSWVWIPFDARDLAAAGVAVIIPEGSRDQCSQLARYLQHHYPRLPVLLPVGSDRQRMFSDIDGPNVVVLQDNMRGWLRNTARALHAASRGVALIRPGATPETSRVCLLPSISKGQAA